MWIDEGYWPDTSIREVVAYDLATKIRTKITDGNVVPSDRWWPTVEGDWVAWMDTRLGMWSIWGHDLVTKKGYFVIGNKAGEFTDLYPQIPRLHRGKLYVIGSTPTYAQLFEVDLPAP